MDINLYFKGILLVLAGVLTGCDSSEDSENTTLGLVSISFVNEAIANVSEQNYENGLFSLWLTDFIHNLKPDNIRTLAAFQTKWKGEVVYYVYDEYFSCILCTTFRSSGEKLEWPKNDFNEFWKSAHDWEIVYLSKSKIHDYEKDFIIY